MRGLGTDHVISGPVRDHKKIACNVTTHRQQTNMATAAKGALGTS